MLSRNTFGGQRTPTHACWKKRHGERPQYYKSNSVSRVHHPISFRASKRGWNQNVSWAFKLFPFSSSRAYRFRLLRETSLAQDPVLFSLSIDTRSVTSIPLGFSLKPGSSKDTTPMYSPSPLSLFLSLSDSICWMRRFSLLGLLKIHWNLLAISIVKRKQFFNLDRNIASCFRSR